MYKIEITKFDIKYYTHAWFFAVNHLTLNLDRTITHAGFIKHRHKNRLVSCDGWIIFSDGERFYKVGPYKRTQYREDPEFLSMLRNLLGEEEDHPEVDLLQIWNLMIL